MFKPVGQPNATRRLLFLVYAYHAIKFVSRVHVKLDIDVLNVGLYRPWRNEQVIGDVLGGFLSDEKLKNFLLAHG